MESKVQIRAKFKNWLNEAVKADYSIISGQAVCEKITEKYLKGPQNFAVSIFISKFPEISTSPLIDQLFRMNARVFIPAWKADEMWMCHVKSKEEFDEIIRSAPPNKIPMSQTEKAPINTVYDFIIMPGLCFDRNCHRLGYGYGHYDYFLSRYFAANSLDARTTKLIGIGYDEQIYEADLPFEEHDIQLDELITPNKVYCK